MAMTFASLTGTKATAGSIRSWVNYDRIDPGEVLFEAEALIYQTLRTREMRASVTLSVAQNDLSEGLPTDFLEPWQARWPSKGMDLTQVHETVLTSRRQWDSTASNYTTGIPLGYAIFDEAVQFECRCDEALTLFLGYHKRPAALSGGNPTNFMTTRYPAIVRAACCAMAADFMDDDAAYQRYAQRLVTLIQAANVEADMSRMTSDLTYW